MNFSIGLMLVGIAVGLILLRFLFADALAGVLFRLRATSLRA